MECAAAQTDRLAIRRGLNGKGLIVHLRPQTLLSKLLSACKNRNAAWAELGDSRIEMCGGPSGIRTQDRRIKSQWLQPQNSPENAPKTPETAGFRPKEHETTQVSGHLPDTKWRQWRHLKKGGNAGLRPKEHTCANIATVRALTATICAGAVNPNASILLRQSATRAS